MKSEALKAFFNLTTPRGEKKTDSQTNLFL